MSRERKVVRVESADAGRVLRSPLVGRLAVIASRGSHLEGGAVLGTMTVLNREVDLVLPDDARGVVVDRLVAGKHPWIEWGQPLVTLAESADALDDAGGAAGTAHAGHSSHPGDPEVPAGSIVVRSPTDGLFYRRPNPESPAYVSEGDAIEPGAVLGLVEVMKCFNPIVYGKDGAHAAPGTVETIFAGDGGEVRSGQVLLVVKPR